MVICSHEDCPLHLNLGGGGVKHGGNHLTFLDAAAPSTSTVTPNAFPSVSFRIHELCPVKPMIVLELEEELSLLSTLTGR